MSKRIVGTWTVLLALTTLPHCSTTPERGPDPANVTMPEGTPIATDAIPEIIVAGQTVYVPAYSHIYSRGARLTFDLTVILTVRNTDRQGEIIVTPVGYYDMNGRLVRDYLDSPIRLDALATTDFVIEESDRTGGSTPSFIVEWVSGNPVSDPLIQSVMIGTMSQQGISFQSEGVVLESR